MNEPNHVIKINTRPYSKREVCFKIIKCVVIAIGIIMIAARIFLDFNLFLEMSWFYKIMFILLIVLVIFHHTNEFGPSPVEIKFYDDYLVVDFVKQFYNKNDIRREKNMFYYDAISAITNQIDGQRIFVFGNLKREEYRYLPDGKLEDTPFKTTEANVGQVNISYRFEKDIDLMKEMELHTPLQVTISSEIEY